MRENLNIHNIIKECIQIILGKEELSLENEMELIDLGLDSSSMVDFIELLNQKFELNMEVDVAYDYTSLGELEQYVNDLLKKNRNQETKQDIISVIIESISQLTGVSTIDIDKTESFVDMGIDSSLSVELIERINDSLKLELEVDAIYDYTTPEEMNHYIENNICLGTVEVLQKEKIENNKQDLIEDIAIIGMSGKIGELEDIQKFWELMLRGERIQHTNRRAGWEEKDTLCSLIKDIDLFDPLFFHISPKEAGRMDPQQRILLEEVYKAFEDSGYPRNIVAGKNIGVFVAARSMDYKERAVDYEGIEAQTFLGNDMSILAGRISFFFDLKGPCMTIDTACSSALTAVHEAVRNLQSDECEMALAAGVFIMPSSQFMKMADKTGMLSDDGWCKTFDENADGMGLAEGAGTIILKPLAKAIEDHDHIYGVIKGTGVNHSGRTQGITVPNTSSQKQLITSIYHKYNINPQSISYIEMQGTGTKIGDQLEVTAHTEAFRQFTDEKKFCAIGSHKPNTGHSIMASGIFGIAKLLMILQEKKLPPTIGIQMLNKGLHLENGPFYINQVCEELKNGRPLRVAISGFGFNGTNCHIILEEGPECQSRQNIEIPYYLMMLSAENKVSLKQKAEDLLKWAENESRGYDLKDISYTLYSGREHFQYRFACVTDTLSDFRKCLAEFIAGDDSSHFVYSDHCNKKDRISALFSRIGRELIVELNQQVSAIEYKEKLLMLAELYMENIVIDFSQLFMGKVYKVPLPTYPFKRKRCHIDEKKNPVLPFMERGKKKNTFPVLDSIPKQHFDEGIIKLEKLAHRIILMRLKQMGGFQKENEICSVDALIENFGVISKYERHIKSIFKILDREKYIHINNDSIQTLKKASDEKSSFAELYDEIENLEKSYPEVRAYINLLRICSKRYQDILIGSVPSTDILFPNASTEVMIGIYCGNLMADYSNELVAAAVEQYVEEKVQYLKAGEKIKIAEIGAGTGATSEPVLKRLEAYQDKIYYAYTDISLGFTRLGVRKFKEKYKFLDFKVLNIEDEVEQQGYETGSFDIVFGTNVFHATSSIDNTLTNIKHLQKKNGIVIINELTKVIDIYTMMFGMLDGWWFYKDPEIRMQDSPLLNVSGWGMALNRNGYQDVQVYGTSPESSERFHQNVIVGISDGVIKEKRSTAVGEAIQAFSKQGVTKTARTTAESVKSKREYVKSKIRYVICEILGIEEDEIECDKSFSEYGIDSIVGLELAEEIDKALRIKLTTTIFFDYPNVNRLTDYIIDKFDIAVEIQNEKRYQTNENEEMPYLKQEMIGILDREHEKLQELVHKMLVSRFHGRGFFLSHSESYTMEELREKVGIEMRYVRLFEAVIRMLAEGGFLTVDENRIFIRNKAVQVEKGDLEKEKEQVSSQIGQLQSYLILVNLCIENIMEIMTGEVSAVDILFGSEGKELVANIYKGNAMINYCNQVVATLIRKRIDNAEGKLRIVEIGAGTGATSEQVFQALRGAEKKVSYTYTDISRRFLEAGAERFSRVAPYAEYKVLDIEKEIEAQGFVPEAYDVVIATNVLHATKNMERTLENVGKLLNQGGCIIVNEATGKLDVNTLIFGLLDGWWLFEDTYNRIPDTPLLSISSWEQIMKKHSFKNIQVYGVTQGCKMNIYQNVIIGEKRDNPENTVKYQKIRTQDKLEKHPPDTGKDEVAIIGISGRFGDAESVEQLWKNLSEGKDSISLVPSERWDYEKYYDPDLRNYQKTNCKWGGFLRNIDLFDPMFFGISGKEAEVSDPQQRIFLTECWKALEDSGYATEKINEKNCSVFVAAMAGDYQDGMIQEGMDLDVHNYVGNAPAILASRISYYLNLKGAAVTVDTACSSSLVAIQLACQSILSGDSEMAVAGGVFLNVTPKFYIQTSNSEMLSPTGVCDAFGNQANGFVPGEGAGVLILKSLYQAVKDGDNIYGTIKGIGLNQDGRTNGITAPSAMSQENLEVSVYKRAGINPETISYIEAHGTGTKLGDPIEIRALTDAFRRFTDKKHFCSIGSIKNNIGHTAMAAGVAGVIKVLMAMKYKKLPPMIHFKGPNEHIDFEDSPFYINTGLKEWKRTDSPRRAAVSSFGFSGTNAHIILEEAPELPIWKNDKRKSEIFVLSAKNKAALQRYSEKLLEAIEGFQGDMPENFFENMIYTLQVGRMQMGERLAILAEDIHDLKKQLKIYISGIDSKNVFVGNSKKEGVEEEEKEAWAEDVQAIWKSEDYKKIAKIWTQGVHIQWSCFYEEEKRRKISLPGYPLEEESYWCLKNLGEMPYQVAVDEGHKGVQYQKYQWERQSISNKKGRDKTVLLISSGGENEKNLVIAGCCKEVIRAQIGIDYQRNARDSYTIDVTEMEHFKRLLLDLKKDSVHITEMIYLCTDYKPEEDILGCLKQGKRISEREIQRQCRKYIMSIFFFVHAYRSYEEKLENFGKVLFVYKSVNKTASPFQEAVAGYGKSFQYLKDKINVVTIELDQENVSAKRLSALLSDELENTDSYLDIRYAGQNREVKKLVTVSLEAKENLPIRNQGLYLITGGLGALGYLVAYNLSKQHSANLVLIGHSELNEEKCRKIEQLKENGTQVAYFKVDVADELSLAGVVREVNDAMGKINGVFHCAGILDVKDIWNRDEARFYEVLQPKVAGILAVDEATKEQPLDIFVAYSSISSIIGDFGQCDYAIANRFMDSFTMVREELRRQGLRNGMMRTINWPLWEKGGMELKEDQREFYLGNMDFLTDKVGISVLNEIMKGQESNLCVMLPIQKTRITNHKIIKQVSNYIEEIIREGIADILHLKKEKLEYDENFGMFGFDSISFKDFAVWLSDKLNIFISPTCFYAHSSISKLAEYLQSEYPELSCIKPENADQEESTETRGRQRKKEQEKIAIVGIAGMMPEADNIYEFWSNLVHEKDCITEIPAQRWDWRKYLTENRHDRGKSVSKWGGFIRDVDAFDAGFFQIPENEVKYIDPQHRLYLQTVWNAFEDSGCCLDSLSGKKIGVFTGVQLRDYEQYFTEDELGEPDAIIGTANTMLSNRISYLLNLHGPSESIDTACSSSLVAVHRAVKAILANECEMAVAGGVSLDLTPEYYIATSRMGIASPTGKCKTFDEDADGYVRGEGIGAVILKPLDRAVEDNDHIYAVIKASVTNHGGRASSMSAPNQEAQAALIEDAYRQAEFLPDTLSYLEVHGTGTELGDPIEVDSLKAAFKALGKQNGKEIIKTGYCGLGTVKTNIGHLEPASGIAGLLKVVLAMEHGILPANLNFHTINPYIKLENSPFYIVNKTIEWKRLKDEAGQEIPRRAGVSSFGFGGTNAHIVLEEYTKQRQIARSDKQREAVFFSAKTKTSLMAYLNSFLAFLRMDMGNGIKAEEEMIDRIKAIVADLIHVEQDSIHTRDYLCDYGIDFLSFANLIDKFNDIFGSNLTKDVFPDFTRVSIKKIIDQLLTDRRKNSLEIENVAYTLNSCREHYSERVVVIAKDIEDLEQKIEKMVRKEETADVLYAGGIKDREKETLTANKETTCLELATKYLEGKKIIWDGYFDKNVVDKVSLPAYAFEKCRYWITKKEINKIELKKYLDRKDRVIADHIVQGKNILPGVAHINFMYETAKDQWKEQEIRLQNLIWKHPIEVTESTNITMELDVENHVIRIMDSTPKGAVVYSESDIEARAQKTEKEWMSIDKIRQRMQREISGEQVYKAYDEIGLHYGKYYRGIETVWFNDKEALGKLAIPEQFRDEAEKFEVHPGIADSGLQTAVSILIGHGILKKHTIVPFTVGEVIVVKKATPVCYAYARLVSEKEYHVAVLDEQGELCIKFMHVNVRDLAPSYDKHILMPVWVEAEASSGISVGSELRVPDFKNMIVIGEPVQLEWFCQQHEVLGTINWNDCVSEEELQNRLLQYRDIHAITWIAFTEQNQQFCDDSMIEFQEKGVLMGLRLAKALGQLGYADESLDWTIVLRNTQMVKETDRTEPAFASITGFAGSMAKEYPDWKVRVLDMDQRGSRELKIWYQMRAQSNGDLYAYRNGIWYIRKLKSWDTSQQSECLYKKNGVYVVIGGSGGIGTIWSRYMIENYQAQIIWIGRKEYNAEIGCQLKELADLGKEPLYMSADASDYGALEAKFKQIKSRFGAVNGVVHSAMVLDDHTIINMDETAFKKCLNAKVGISVRIAQVFEKEELDFVLFFSSLMSFTKAAGQSNYAAGCSFKDSFALSLSKIWNCKVKIMNWGFWSEKGAVSDKKYLEQLASVYFAPIVPEEGLEALKLLMSSTINQMAYFHCTGEIPENINII